MPYCRVFYHIIWGTNNREPFMDNPIVRRRVHAAIVAKAVELGADVQAVGGTHDHVHLVASVPPKLALSYFIGQIKGSSSHFASRLNAGRIEPFEWQAEYGLLTVSESHLQLVVRYVRNQAEHHKLGTTRATLEHLATQP